MEFRFDSNQEYQLQAIDSIIELFKGQPKLDREFNFGVASVENHLDLDAETILGNLQEVQTQNNIPVDSTLQYIDVNIGVAKGRQKVSFTNFSVEMETGTGKTYVYLRTIFELYLRYGLRKYIVVVPSVAIREGVIKTLKVTEKHFQELYSNTPYHYYTYDSENLTRVRQFVVSDSIEIMVMTIAAFNKDANVIRQSTDRLQGDTPIHMIQSVRPILVLDEPQNMESEKSIAALSALNPLFALRYSATHRNPYNVVYRLTPFEAYRQNLVKRIEVASVLEKDDMNRPFIKLEGIETKKNTITARLTVHKLTSSGTIKEQSITVRPSHSLRVKTQRPEYDGYEIEEINAARQTITFANGVEIGSGESFGSDKEAVFEAQIRYTIEEHFRKQARLKKDGIKVLSLIFIDRVDNYAPVDGIIRQLFNKAFDELKIRYPDFKDRKADEVQAAYFANSKKRSGEVIYEDSSSGVSKKDEEVYNLIMKDKERLLSHDEPVSFIFSHSALREGWDNPNVFQICTLNQTASDVKKRQEIGRGVRLAVNDSGQRIRDERVNILTVVANESYERYVDTLQQEYIAEYGAEGVPPKPDNARKRKIANLRKEYLLDAKFKELWNRVSQKTRYAVTIDSEKLVSDVVSGLDRIDIKPPRIIVAKSQVEVGDMDELTALEVSHERTTMDLSSRRDLPDIVSIMVHLLENTSPPIRLTRTTLLEIFKRSSKKEMAMKNPQAYSIATVQLIRECIAEQLVSGIKYEKINKWYEMTQFQSEIESWEEYLIPSERSVYDHIVFDSDIEKEFVEGLERRADVKMYVKLPAWFTVPTPVGSYNPDWAIVMEERDEHGESTGRPLLYLVRETKSGEWRTDLRPDEKRKITCGERHFKDTLGVDYRVVTNAAELP